MPDCYIKRRDDFIRLLRRSRVVQEGIWEVRYVRARGANKQPRLAVNIGKKFLRHAVRRNRVRRQLREAFRQHWRGRLAKMDFLIRPRDVVPPDADVCAACLRLLERVK